MFYKFSYRYLISKKSTNAINVIAWVSIVAITIVTAAMITVMSVFNGLTGLVKGLYKGFYTDLQVKAISGKVVTLSPEQINTLTNTPGIAQVSYVAEEKAMMKIGENQTVVTLKGVDENYKQITDVAKHIKRGSYDLGNDEVPKLVLGYGIENALDILSNQATLAIQVYMPNRQQRFTGKLEDFNTAEAVPMGTFAIQQEFDNKYVLTNIGFVKQLMGLDSNQYTSVDVAIQPNENLEQVQEALKKTLGNEILVQNKYQQNRSLYNVMRSEKWMLYAIFCLILMISSFTIIGALTMLVLEKQKDITILKSMGGSDGFVQKIFLAEGGLLALIGVGLGTIIGLGLCFVQQKFKLLTLQGGSFVVDYYPVEIQLGDIILVIITVTAITLIAAYFPARKAAKQAIELK
jgi:lipoprotein-releasing system permease protein